MTSQQLTCKRCEHTGWDVHSRIVVVEQPELVQYSGLAHQVPERFRREARCIDREACDERADKAATA